MFPEYTGRKWEAGIDISPLQTQSDVATRLRIPLLATSQPRWNYITGIVVGGMFPDDGILPTDDEIIAVAARLEEYCTSWYYQSFRNVMTEFAPYDIDGGANLGYFIKYDNGGWAYRKRTWERGAYWLPLRSGPAESLLQVLDRTRHI